MRGGSGGTPNSNKPQYYGGDIPFLGISDISNSSIEGKIFQTSKTITKEGLESSTAWIVPKGSISLAMYASVGKVAVLEVNSATSQAFYNMVFDNSILRDFIYFTLSKMEIENQWTNLVSTGTQPNLNAQKVKTLPVLVTDSAEEMRLITLIFIQLDELITLHQRELEKLQNIKKSMLEKMLV